MALISYSILSFKSAISLIFVLYTRMACKVEITYTQNSGFSLLHIVDANEAFQIDHVDNGKSEFCM